MNSPSLLTQQTWVNVRVTPSMFMLVPALHIHIMHAHFRYTGGAGPVGPQCSPSAHLDRTRLSFLTFLIICTCHVALHGVTHGQISSGPHCFSEFSLIASCLLGVVGFQGPQK